MSKKPKRMKDNKIQNNDSSENNQTKKIEDDIVQNNNNKEKTKKDEKPPKSKTKKVFIIILEIFFVVVMLVSGIMIILWARENKRNNEILEQIADTVTIDETKNDDEIEKYTVNFSELKSKNPDTVAWLKVNGTNIEYPVVKAKDNDYYLNHSFDKSYNGAGWTFADYRNKFDGADKNIIVYGHNRKDRSMFGSLKNVLNKEWHENEENRKILFFTEEEESIYEVFSIYKIKDESYYIQTNFSSNSYLKFLQTIKKRSIYKFDVELNENDQILTLSTCDSNNEYRLVVHAKKLVDEKNIAT